ncbi:MAG TPA: hypothetical protein VGP18_02475 [Solirubrobacteraceae bacterium]|jgi:hypothetical protein|nr:hypothetical protein [Solirubrobacteraceae bacterium]
MPDDNPTIDHMPTNEVTAQTQPVAVQAPAGATYESAEDEWLEEPPESELPPRPRRRLLTPVPLALMGVLAIACGFIGGVLVEKGQSSSSSSGAGTSGLASRFAALRAGASGASATSGTGARSGAGAAAGGFGGGASGAAGFKRPTAGTVAYLDGDTLYVTNVEGNTVKVTTSAGTTVNKTVKSSVKGIHPGETVTITGETGSGGSLSAESISVGSGGGLAALFGGSSARGGSGSSSSHSGGGEPALFGG